MRNLNNPIPSRDKKGTITSVPFLSRNPGVWGWKTPNVTDAGETNFIRDEFVKQFGEIESHQKWILKSVDYVLKKDDSEHKKVLNMLEYTRLSADEKKLYKKEEVFGENNRDVIDNATYRSLSADEKKCFLKSEEIIEHTERVKDTHGHYFVRHSKQNKVELFRAWFTDMIRSAGVRCEMFGGSLGPDVVVNENGFVAYISVEGAFDDNPDICIDKMTGDLTDNKAAFRQFIQPEDRDKKVFYAFLVKNEESFENRKTILKTIEKKTGNKHGCVINLQELLEVFNEAAAKGEEKNIGHIIEQLFNSKRQ